MAGSDYQAKSTDRSNNVTILAAEGVQFLLSGEEKVPLSSCDGKTACLFFSANWCRTCKTFIPKLVQIYDMLSTRCEKMEIVFVSFDHNENQFEEHFKCMPWLAAPFDVNLSRRLSKRYHVKHLPSLIALNSDETSIEEDLVGLIEDYGAEAFPFTRSRREELKAADTAKLEGGKLVDLLAHKGRSHLIAMDGRKVVVSELVGKTIGIYFGAHWCPPCHTFTAQLLEVYNELTTSEEEQRFEIIFVSTDRDLEEFGMSLKSMPWLAIPYSDKTRHDLCRIFDIKGIPSLVMIGPEGKPISTNGKGIISLYGAKAFPFTESKLRDLEAALRKEGDALPRQVNDIKHEHLLKLDMAKEYLCDSCKKRGRFWAFSCDVCDYDLHPCCMEETS
ncbi:probable nucleoredoxin 3 [Juglans microcarpa x Juglans regia]|uniref:probable nucleoredoxin 3 n=1 Tax=Juglans microcarpa x Juglans regia TaxID=2249226 RepID=UPI001B7E7B74|nr:probable nucleoredoxin 3 [Juglans microcarpa x Juglans regia]